MRLPGRLGVTSELWNPAWGSLWGGRQVSRRGRVDAESGSSRCSHSGGSGLLEQSIARSHQDVQLLNRTPSRPGTTRRRNFFKVPGKHWWTGQASNFLVNLGPTTCASSRHASSGSDKGRSVGTLLSGAKISGRCVCGWHQARPRSAGNHPKKRKWPAVSPTCDPTEPFLGTGPSVPKNQGS
jgi:hypothetical protein